jgi:uncharacterized membrane protein
MKLKSISDLIIINTLSIVFILIVTLFSSNILRMILSVPFVCFFPGYTAMAFFFPRRDTLSPIERIVLSVASSIAITTLIGFCLSFTPWGIDIYPIVLSVTIFVVIMSILAWYRHRKIKE